MAVGTFRKPLSGVLDVDLLMLLAAIGATVMGRVGEAAVLLFLFALGHALEHLAMRRATRAIEALGEFAPAVARRIRDGDPEEEVPVEEVGTGAAATGEREMVEDSEEMHPEGGKNG